MSIIQRGTTTAVQNNDLSFGGANVNTQSYTFPFEPSDSCLYPSITMPVSQPDLSLQSAWNQVPHADSHFHGNAPLNSGGTLWWFFIAMLLIDITETLFHPAYDDFSLILNDGNEDLLTNLADMAWGRWWNCRWLRSFCSCSVSAVWTFYGLYVYTLWLDINVFLIYMLMWLTRMQNTCFTYLHWQPSRAHHRFSCCILSSFHVQLFFWK